MGADPDLHVDVIVIFTIDVERESAREVTYHFALAHAYDESEKPAPPSAGSTSSASCL